MAPRELGMHSRTISSASISIRRAASLGLHLADATELRIDLLGGLFANVAGVEDDEIGFLRNSSFHIRIARQKINHTMRIVDVHLTAVGFNVELAQALGIPANFPKNHRCRPAAP